MRNGEPSDNRHPYLVPRDGDCNAKEEKQKQRKVLFCAISILIFRTLAGVMDEESR